MWFLHQLDSQSPAYNVLQGVRLVGALRPEVLAACITAVTRRHQVHATPYALPAPRRQYADFAVWQRRWLQGDALEAQRASWRPQLAPPLPVLRLPADRPRSEAEGFRAGVESIVLSAGLAADLRSLGGRHGA